MQQHAALGYTEVQLRTKRSPSHPLERNVATNEAAVVNESFIEVEKVTSGSDLLFQFFLHKRRRTVENRKISVIWWSNICIGRPCMRLHVISLRNKNNILFASCFPMYIFEALPVSRQTGLTCPCWIANISGAPCMRQFSTCLLRFNGSVNL